MIHTLVALVVETDLTVELRLGATEESGCLLAPEEG